MSRDPGAGNEFEPMSFHRYLYAGGEPVDGLDPLGQEDLAEYRFNISIIKVGAYVALAAIGIGIACEFMEDAEVLREAEEAAEAKGKGPSVGPSPGGISCGGPHPAPGGPGHPDPYEPIGGPEPTPISGPPIAGAP